MLAKVRKAAAVIAATIMATAATACGVAAADTEVVLTVRPPDGGAACDYSMSDLEEMDMHVLEASVHWLKGSHFEGPLIKDILSTCRSADSSSVRITALNEYSSVVPTSDFDNWPVILATRIDGQRVSIRDKGPLLVMYPYSTDTDLRNHVYYGRGVWQVRSIDAMAQ